MKYSVLVTHTIENKDILLGKKLKFLTEEIRKYSENM